ncbi:SIMPL domain-containing protein [Roseibacillus persicicus]|uniref:DUF541 domain-containing protein n=1 Tax=Roseibacillus persicicus TaxID=454148 RepID=A0A918WRH7_9BACT|nr:SIMPL domain-containing protein [Roseibacillus persicicus]GHC68096.1 hypothetical protein GCM10007100_40210 [Roseibacillus persicicus]
MKRALILCVALFRLPLLASPIPDFPFVNVTGASDIEVAPDTATITFTVLEYNEDPGEATATVNSSLRAITDEVITLGVEASGLTADDFEKRAIRIQTENNQPLEIKGYEVSREVRIKIEKIENYTAVVQVIMKKENVGSISSYFDTTRREEIELELVGKSCAEAKKKALVLSKGVGVDLGGVFAVSDTDFSSFGGEFGFGYGGGGMLLGGAGRSDAPVFVPATIKLYASVSVLYRLGSEGVAKD